MRIVILPIGSIEQHGDILPSDVDFILASKFAKICFDKLKITYPEAFLLPTIPFSVAGEHSSFPESISIQSVVFFQYVGNIFSSIASSYNPDLIILYNSHGGNQSILNALTSEFNYSNKCKAYYYSHFNSDVENKIEEIWGIGETHAGSFESSVYKYFTNDSEANGRKYKSSDYKKRISGGLKLFKTSELCKLGIINDSDTIEINFEYARRIIDYIESDFNNKVIEILNKINTIYGSKF